MSQTTSSKPGGVSVRAMSRLASGWRGPNRILVALLTSLLSQRDRRRHANLVAQDSRGVALARRVLDQPGVAGAEDVLGAVAQADLELAGEDDDELAAWGRMPVEVLAERPLAERDLRRRQALRPLRHAPEVDRLDARLPIGARVESKRSHRSPPVPVVGTDGMGSNDYEIRGPCGLRGTLPL